MKVYIVRGPSKSLRDSWVLNNVSRPKVMEDLDTALAELERSHRIPWGLVLSTERSELWYLYPLVRRTTQLRLPLSIRTLLPSPDSLARETGAGFSACAVWNEYYTQEAMPEEWDVDHEVLGGGNKDYVAAVKRRYGTKKD